MESVASAESFRPAKGSVSGPRWQIRQTGLPGDHEFDELVRITANKLKEGFGRRGGKVAPRGTSRPETLGGFPPGKRKPRASVSTEQGLKAIIIARWVWIRVQI
jgi:hypothetical protein